MALPALLVALARNMHMPLPALNTAGTDYSCKRKGGVAMKCPRCQGRMFAEKFYDFVRSFDAWKCTCCGEMVDSTILANRARSANTFLG